MAYFYNHKDNNEFGEISVIPRQWYRRFFKIGSFSFFPYITMGKIDFTLKVDRFPESSKYLAQNIYIRLGDGSYKVLATIQSKITQVIGIPEYTGDTKIFIASSSYSNHNSERFIDKVGILIFDDHILSINHYIFGSVSLLALIFSCLCVFLGWLVGFIKIFPFWEIWIPVK